MAGNVLPAQLQRVGKRLLVCPHETGQLLSTTTRQYKIPAGSAPWGESIVTRMNNSPSSESIVMSVNASEHTRGSGGEQFAPYSNRSSITEDGEGGDGLFQLRCQFRTMSKCGFVRRGDNQARRSGRWRVQEVRRELSRPCGTKDKRGGHTRSIEGGYTKFEMAAAVTASCRARSSTYGPGSRAAQMRNARSKIEHFRSFVRIWESRQDNFLSKS